MRGVTFALRKSLSPALLGAGSALALESWRAGPLEAVYHEVVGAGQHAGLPAGDGALDDLAVYLHGNVDRRAHVDVAPAEALDVRAPDVLALAVEDAREERPHELHGVTHLEHDDVEQPVVHDAAGDDLDVALDHGVVGHDAGDAVTLDARAVDLDDVVDHAWGGVGERGHEVGGLAHGALVGGRSVHELGVVARARHDREAPPVLLAVLGVPEHFAQVAPHGVAPAAGPRQGRWLGGVADVGEQQVCRAGGKDAGGDGAAVQGVEQARHRAVAAREHHHVIVLGVGERLLGHEPVAQLAQQALVARVDELSLEGEDRVGAKAAPGVVDDETAHGVPFRVSCGARRCATCC